MHKLCAVFLLSAAAFAADPDGAAIYKTRCAACHDASGVTRAPAPAALRMMSPDNIVRTLESGVMKEQGAALTAAERRAVAEYLTGRAIGSAAPALAGQCANLNATFEISGPSWNGWGSSLANNRFQSSAEAGLSAADVPRLKLKWAFAFPNTFVSNGQPAVVGGRVFVASANRNIYSLDAKTGCRYWSFTAQAPVRTAITIVRVHGHPQVFFGDRRANAYSLNAQNGELLWKTRIDDHPHASITGAPSVSGGTVFVPLVAAEEGTAMNSKYECCSARGGIVALDVATGRQIWKTYTIAETPHPTTKNSLGVQMWGPSGASIWSSPTIDPEKGLVYAGTGDNFSDPDTKTSDAVIAFDMKSGKIRWMKQITEKDVYNMACNPGPSKASCPGEQGPDVDIGASPILVKGKGRSILLVSQKSAVATALDADHNGKILWQTRVGKGGELGGIQWGSASDGQKMYVALSDIGFLQMEFTRGKPLIVDPQAGGGLFALDVLTGKKIWSAPPPVCGARPKCSPAQSAAISVIPGAVFSGSIDGHLRAYSTDNGKIIWDFDTARDFSAVDGIPAKGGSMDGPGPVIAGGMVFVPSGYGNWGGMTGNVLLAFSIDGN